MSWKTALFAQGNMVNKVRFFLEEAREAHARITNLMILTSPALAGAWQFRHTTKHFASLSDPVPVRDAVLSFIELPSKETAIRRMDLRESVLDVPWERQRDSIAEMMFLVACSIYENFTSAVQHTGMAGGSSATRVIEKGFQFPATHIDRSTNPATVTPSPYRDNWRSALGHLPQSNFMVAQTFPSFPIDGRGRNILDDFEAKMQVYLLFKKFRNTIAHGGFDTSIPEQFEVVSHEINATDIGTRHKPILSKDAAGVFSLDHYNVIGFLALLLSIIRDIDRFFQLSVQGENELCDRLSRTKDAKQNGASERIKEFSRLRRCVAAVGLPEFNADQAAVSHLIARGVWRL